MLTETQREFLARARQLASHGMGIMPRGTLQRRMVLLLAELGYLVYNGMGTHEETGVEGEMWRITDAGVAALNESSDSPRREGLRELTRLTEDAGGYDKEREEEKKP